MTDRDPRVDWSDTPRPGVLGGECARCLHREPLHEHGCALLPCIAPNPCGCFRCFILTQGTDEPPVVPSFLADMKPVAFSAFAKQFNAMLREQPASVLRALGIEEHASASTLMQRETTNTSMTDAQLMALAALAIVDAEDVRAANMDRETRGEAMAYDHVQPEAADALRGELKRRGVLRGGR